MSSIHYSLTNTTAITSVESVSEWSDAGTAVGGPWNDTSDPSRNAGAGASVVKCYIRQAILCIGIPGNVVCWVVFWKQGLSDRINLLLFWLAVIDFLNLSMHVPTILTCYSSDRVFANNVMVIGSAKTNRIRTFCSVVSGTLVVVMSVERCLCVVIPFKARSLLTYRSMVTAILLSYLIPFLAYLPLFLSDSVMWRVDSSTNRSIAYMAPTSWFPAGKFQTSLPSYLNLIGQPLSFVIVVVCSITTIVHLHRTSLKRSEMTGKSSVDGKTADVRLTVMLLFLCIVCAIVILLQTVYGVILNFLPKFYPYVKYHSFARVVIPFLSVASCMNSSVNVCAYLVLSSRFRATLKQTFCPGFCGR